MNLAMSRLLNIARTVGHINRQGEQAELQIAEWFDKHVLECGVNLAVTREHMRCLQDTLPSYMEHQKRVMVHELGKQLLELAEFTDRETFNGLVQEVRVHLIVNKKPKEPENG